MFKPVPPAELLPSSNNCQPAIARFRCFTAIDAQARAKRCLGSLDAEGLNAGTFFHRSIHNKIFNTGVKKLPSHNHVRQNGQYVPSSSLEHGLFQQRHFSFDALLKHIDGIAQIAQECKQTVWHIIQTEALRHLREMVRVISLRHLHQCLQKLSELSQCERSTPPSVNYHHERGPDQNISLHILHVSTESAKKSFNITKASKNM